VSKSLIVRLFIGSLIGLAGGLVLLAIAGGLALSTDVFIMRGSDVVGVRSGAVTWTLLGFVGLAILVMMAAAIAVFVAWIGAVLNTANLPSKTWCVVLVVIGLLGAPFIATLAYVVAGPDGAPEQKYATSYDPAGGATRARTGDSTAVQ
jgi:hypothetical protein